MHLLVPLKTRTLRFFTTLILSCAALSPAAFAVVPAPDGGYPGFTTAEGTNALKNLTTGVGNTALGWYSLFTNSSGSYNTGVGAGALLLNTTAEQNTATGVAALFNHSTGNGNTANGALALFSDTSGQLNTAIGAGALYSNVGGPFPGSFNTAVGATALYNSTGGDNTAVGAQALQSNSTGNDNIAIGVSSLGANTSGNSNIAFGTFAGLQQTTGSNNIYIGYNLQGSAGENDACYIKSIFNQTSVSAVPVYINASHKLGTIVSSNRFKEGIKPMDNASQALYALQPVTFRYKKEVDPSGTSQLGLVAEDVEKVNSALVVHDNEGKPYSVRYDQVNAMLLNEFLKEHKAFVEEQRKVEQQQQDIDLLKTELKQQRALIERVNDKVELKAPASQIAVNKQ